MTGQIHPRNSLELAKRQMGPVRASATNPAAPVITPKDVYLILRRHIWLIMFFFVLGIMISGAAWFLCNKFIPAYTAKALVKVLPQSISDPFTISNPQLNKDIQYQNRNSKATLMKQQTMLVDLLNYAPARNETRFPNKKVRDTQWFKKYVKGNGSDDSNTDIAGAIEDLEKNLRVSPQRDNDFIIVSMTCTGHSGKKESALIVNLFVEMFVKNQQDTATEESKADKKLYEQQKTEVEFKLAKANSVLDNIIAGSKVTGTVSKTGGFRDYLEEKMADLELRYSSLESETIRIQSEVKLAEEKIKNIDFDAIVRDMIERDPVATTMRRNIATLEVTLAEQLARFGPGHRRVKEIQDSLKQAQMDLDDRKKEIGQIEQKRRLQLAQDTDITLKTELQERKRQLEAAREEHRELSKIRANYEKAEATRDELQKMLEDINLQIEKFNLILNDTTLAGVTVSNYAAEPLQVSFPNPVLFIAAGVILGLMSGVGLAFAIEMMNDTLRSPSDVMRHVNIPLLGMVCHEDEDYNLKGVDLNHVIKQAPYSIMSECYRQIRANLKLSAPDTSQKTLLFTSCNTGEGKTSLAVNTTFALAADDKRVLFVDTNFRRPSSTTEFKVDTTQAHPDSGLSNYLLGQCQSESEIIRNSGIEGLDIIDCGPLPSNPAELLGSARMKQLLDSVSQDYDYVIIDGPPLIVSDAKSIASLVDGTILVFNAEMTHRGAAQRALRELQEINVNVIGSVLMGVRTMKGGYFDEIFKSYVDYQQVKVRPTA